MTLYKKSIANLRIKLPQLNKFFPRNLKYFDLTPSTMESYTTIKDGDVSLATNRLIVVIRLPDLKTVEVEAAYSDTIGFLKKQLEKKFGFPVKKQIWMYGVGELEDHKTITESDFQNDSAVVLAIKERIQIFVEPFEGEPKELFFMPTETIEKVKKSVEEEFKISFDDDQIDLVTPEINERLEDSKTLSDYGIEDGVKLKLKKSEMTLVIRTLNKTIELIVQLSDTIAMIKKKIAEKADIPVNCQMLIHGQKALYDSLTVSEAEIQRDTSIILVIDEKAHEHVKASAGKTDSFNN